MPSFCDGVATCPVVCPGQAEAAAHFRARRRKCWTWRPGTASRHRAGAGVPRSSRYGCGLGERSRTRLSQCSRRGRRGSVQRGPRECVRSGLGRRVRSHHTANFLQHFSPEECTTVLQKVRSSLAPQGRACTVDFVPDEDRAKTPTHAMFAFLMLATTHGGDAYTLASLTKLQRRPAFRGRPHVRFGRRRSRWSCSKPEPPGAPGPPVMAAIDSVQSTRVVLLTRGCLTKEAGTRPKPSLARIGSIAWRKRYSHSVEPGRGAPRQLYALRRRSRPMSRRGPPKGLLAPIIAASVQRRNGGAACT